MFVVQPAVARCSPQLRAPPRSPLRASPAKPCAPRRASVAAMAGIQRFEVGPRMSEASVFNGIVHLAGQVADDESQDITGQTKQVLASIDRLLQAAGSDKSRILMTQIFLKNLTDFAAMNAVWEAWVVAGHTPPRATVQANLANDKWLIEVVITAAAATPAAL